jgi:hypothetical protein
MLYLVCSTQHHDCDLASGAMMLPILCAAWRRELYCPD